MTEVSKLDWRTLIKAAPETPPETITALDKYFEPFAQPALKMVNDKPDLGDQPCLKCDEPQTGLLASMFGKGGFTWGLAHGEGHCRNCHWPARAYHFIKHEDGSDLCTLRGVILQYHPDYVTERKTDAA